jgi:hypothetical protein
MHPICNVQTYFNHTLIEVVTRLAGGQPPPGETAGVDRPGPGITPLSPPVHRSTPSLMFSQQDGAARPISSAFAGRLSHCCGCPVVSRGRDVMSQLRRCYLCGLMLCMQSVLRLGF